MTPLNCSATELAAEQNAASNVVSTFSDAQPPKPPHYLANAIKTLAASLIRHLDTLHQSKALPSATYETLVRSVHLFARAEIERLNQTPKDCSPLAAQLLSSLRSL